MILLPRPDLQLGQLRPLSLVLSASRRLILAPSYGGSGRRAPCNEKASGMHKAFPSLCCVIFVNVSLAKANLVAKPRYRGGEIDSTSHGKS